MKDGMYITWLNKINKKTFFFFFNKNVTAFTSLPVLLPAVILHTQHQGKELIF